MHGLKKQTTDFCNEIDVWSAKEELWTFECKWKVQSHVNIYVGG